MEKVIELNIEEKELKRYLEECLIEEKINYEIKIEDRWIQKFKEASKYYQVYCLYVNNNDIDKVKQIIKDYENGIIITEDIEELKDAKNEEDDYRFKIFTEKKFLKYYWAAIAIIGILIFIGMKFIK